jgi:multimeric flavodoxin WrbA
MPKPERIRVLGVVGSPRRGGNTELLVDEVLAAAEKAGAQVEKIMLGDLDIAPCRACYTCRKQGRCAIEDDMQGVLEKMEASRVWVIGTPVYWWGPSAQVKAFVDRWFSRAGDEEHMRIFKDRRVVLAVPMGDTDPKTGRHVVGMFEDALAYVGADLFASILAAGSYDKGDVRQDKEALEAARKAGEGVVVAD